MPALPVWAVGKGRPVDVPEALREARNFVARLAIDHLSRADRELAVPCQPNPSPINCPVERRWIIAQACAEANAEIPWAEICGLPCIAELLKRKGFNCADEVNAFLQPRLRSLSDPFLLPNMATAVERILIAIDRRERVVLFGDYDVDGVTSLAL